MKNIFTKILKWLFNKNIQVDKITKCEYCKNYKNDGCPNSSLCYSTINKKYYIPK